MGYTTTGVALFVSSFLCPKGVILWKAGERNEGKRNFGDLTGRENPDGIFTGKPVRLCQNRGGTKRRDRSKVELFSGLFAATRRSGNRTVCGWRLTGMRITVNGKEVEGQWSTAFEVQRELGKDCDVVIVNGYQIEDDCTLRQGDTLHLIRKGILPKKDQLESMMAARHTPKVHERMKKGRVAVAGLGGLGSHIAVMLARTGVGHLLLLDYDVVEPSNLNRQNYSVCHLGLPKTEAMLSQIHEINPYVEVSARNVRLTEENTLEILKGWDIVCEAFDKPEVKAMLVNTVLTGLPSVKVVAASGMAGYGSSNSIQTLKKMSRLYVCGDSKSESRIGMGLMAPRVEICAGHQANMVLRLLLGIQDV